MAIKMTREEYQKKYGVQPDFSNASFKKPESKDGPITSSIKEAFNQGKSQVKKGNDQINQATNPLQALESGVTTAAGIANMAFSPLAPIGKPIGKAINSVSEKISDIPQVQNFANSKSGKVASRITENISNVNTVAGAVAPGPKVAGLVGRATEETASNLGRAASYGKNIAKDVIPNTERVIEHQVSRALDLAPSDIANISKSTGNSVGRWLADNNLIRENKAQTQSALRSFFEQNHKLVREEIGKVKNVYKQSQVPRYVESLKSIKAKTDDVPGLQAIGVEIDNLLNKKTIELTDVQRVKELMDEHFNLYSVTGEVSENIAKQGLANIRKDLQTFIEGEVKKSTGADIRKLNNNVSTSKSIDNAVTLRDPKGLTRSNIRLGDLGVFGAAWSASGSPLVGVAAVFGKKLMESPAVRLRIAKYLDGISDARKAKIAQALQQGKIPAEFQQFIKKRASSPENRKTEPEKR